MVRVSDCGSVDCRAVLDLPLSGPTVWGQIRDFSRYARRDLFHSVIDVDGGIARAGANLRLRHDLMGVTARRVGRILLWREGEGYAFSDLSRRGPRHGFPHVFRYRIESTGPDSSRLHISIRGRWTAPVPRWTARLWLRWVFSHLVYRVENELLLYLVWRRRRSGSEHLCAPP